MLAGAIFCAGLSCGRKRERRTVEVRRGQFTVAHSEDGELTARKTVTLASRVKAEISFVAEDHSAVKKGDVVVELEKRDREERRKFYADSLSASESKLSDKERNLDIQRANLEVEVEKKRASIRLSEVRLEQSDSLPHPEDLEIAEKTLEASLAAFEQAEKALKAALELNRRGFVSEEELEDIRFRRDVARISTEKTRIRLKQVKRGATGHERKRLVLELEVSGGGLELTELLARSTLASLEQQVKWARAEVSRWKETIRKNEENIALRSIRAPRDGIVLRCKRRWERDKVDVGTRTWPGIGIVEIPDLSAMRAETQIPESIITFFRVGDRAEVAVEDVEGVFEGTISWIDSWARDRNAELAGADQEREGLSGVRVFRCHVDLAEKVEEMRLGSKARVTFRHVLEDVLYLDKRAVVTSSGSPYLVVPDGRWVAVETGQENEESVVIVSGAAEGTEVVLQEGGTG